VKTNYTIGKMAILAGVSIDTLRYYEKINLIVPVTKTTAGYRLYNDETIRQVRFIKEAQAHGFSLLDTKELLVMRNKSECCCKVVRSLAIEKKLRIIKNIKELESMSIALDKLIKNCSAVEEQNHICPILEKSKIINNEN
jgi:MerR family Zn(II)-responsive transcriptional regulator of zntA